MRLAWMPRTRGEGAWVCLLIYFYCAPFKCNSKGEKGLPNHWRLVVVVEDARNVGAYNAARPEHDVKRLRWTVDTGENRGTTDGG